MVSDSVVTLYFLYSFDSATTTKYTSSIIKMKHRPLVRKKKNIVNIVLFSVSTLNYFAEVKFCKYTEAKLSILGMLSVVLDNPVSANQIRVTYLEIG